MDSFIKLNSVSVTKVSFISSLGTPAVFTLSRSLAHVPAGVAVYFWPCSLVVSALTIYLPQPDDLFSV